MKRAVLAVLGRTQNEMLPGPEPRRVSYVVPNQFALGSAAQPHDWSAANRSIVPVIPSTGAAALDGVSVQRQFETNSCAPTSSRVSGSGAPK